MDLPVKGFKKIEASANDLDPKLQWLLVDAAGATATLVDHYGNTETGVALPAGLIPVAFKKITALTGNVYAIYNLEDNTKAVLRGL